MKLKILSPDDIPKRDKKASGSAFERTTEWVELRAAIDEGIPRTRFASFTFTPKYKEKAGFTHVRTPVRVAKKYIADHKKPYIVRAKSIGDADIMYVLHKDDVHLLPAR